MPERPLARWVPAWAAATAAAVAGLALVVHAWQAYPDGYLGCIGGIWLALAKDLSGGVFFRDLIGPLGYGGTRYFPLFFTLIGSLMAVGIPPLVAGWVAGGASALALGAGAARVARAFGVPRHVCLLAAAGVLAPYFVQQTVFEIRADVLAAGLNLLGLAAVVRSVAAPAAPPRLWPAAAWFALAFATKITSLAVPGAVCVALALSGAVAPALRLLGGVTAGAVGILAVIQGASAGRALVSWRACMLAGSNAWDTAGRVLAGEFLIPLASSHLVAVIFLAAILTIAASIARARRSLGRGVPALPGGEGPGPMRWLPATLFATSSVLLAFTLASPGTVPSNHVVEWLAVAVTALVATAAMRPDLRMVVSCFLVLVVLWMSAQDVLRVRELSTAGAARATAPAGHAVVDRVRQSSAPILSESPVWPILAGQHPILIDPFALRVVMASRPDIARDLEERIEARRFAAIVLQADPTSSRGRGFYEHLHFGWPVMSRIVSSYRLDSHPATDVWIYVPKGRDER